MNNSKIINDGVLALKEEQWGRQWIENPEQRRRLDTNETATFDVIR